MGKALLIEIKKGIFSGWIGASITSFIINNLDFEWYYKIVIIIGMFYITHEFHRIFMFNKLMKKIEKYQNANTTRNY